MKIIEETKSNQSPDKNSDANESVQESKRIKNRLANIQYTQDEFDLNTSLSKMEKSRSKESFNRNRDHG